MLADWLKELAFSDGGGGGGGGELYEFCCLFMICCCIIIIINIFLHICQLILPKDYWSLWV